MPTTTAANELGPQPTVTPASGLASVSLPVSPPEGPCPHFLPACLPACLGSGAALQRYGDGYWGIVVWFGREEGQKQGHSLMDKPPPCKGLWEIAPSAEEVG